LAFFGGVAGLLAVLGSAIAFVFSQSIGIYRALTWDDGVAITDLTYPLKMTVVNVGPGGVFITGIEFYGNYGSVAESSQGIPLSQYLDVAGVAQIDLRDIVPEAKQFKDLNLRIMQNKSGKPTQAVIADSDTDADKNEKKCIYSMVTTTNSMGYKQYERHYKLANNKTVIDDSATMFIDIVATKSGKKIAQKVRDVVKLFGIKIGPDCDEKIWSRDP
jgi:hypothetical protein